MISGILTEITALAHPLTTAEAGTEGTFPVVGAIRQLTGFIQKHRLHIRKEGYPLCKPISGRHNVNTDRKLTHCISPGAIIRKTEKEMEKRGSLKKFYISSRGNVHCENSMNCNQVCI